MAEGKPGPPKNVGEPKSFQVTIPARLYDYLTLLAKRSFRGTSETGIASRLLQNKLEEMYDAKAHDTPIPRD